MTRFNGKTVVVTGSARGQGAAEIRRFHQEGANVVVSDLLVDDGETLAASLGERAMFIEHDVSSEGSWRELFGQVEQTFGGCDVLVNNAGIYRPATIAETDSELMEKMFRVNQLGVLLGMKYAMEPLRRRGGGSIINISSVVGLRGSAATVAYGSTKWAVRGMTKVAANEFAEHRIRVNSVHPGYVSTEMLKANSEASNNAGTLATPLQRQGAPEEIAALVAFLASDESAFITGAEIAIDGGWTL
ncbi:glucose 1-dehydrogenase [Pseudomonas gingeri]|uniref:SDR family NAD(P)-dependent oxidoreductase n=1 Tax=Pseudomonas gingeri TaxID=117681 RepID=UPI0015A13565|nr:glucose 1-dehydrogenase [Pseudomonas gingeri]NVZ24669.1 glucose 1-dehydrogenase [Pseudomonas gingeri]